MTTPNSLDIRQGNGQLNYCGAFEAPLQVIMGEQEPFVATDELYEQYVRFTNNLVSYLSDVAKYEEWIAEQGIGGFIRGAFQPDSREEFYAKIHSMKPSQLADFLEIIRSEKSWFDFLREVSDGLVAGEGQDQSSSPEIARLQRWVMQKETASDTNGMDQPGKKESSTRRIA